MASPTYRYYTADLLTGNVLGDIKLTGTSAGMELGGQGTFDGTFMLGQPLDSYNLALTIPGRTALYIERNDELIWGGIIWSRMHSNDDSRVIDISALVFDSYYGHVVLEKNYVKQ